MATKFYLSSTATTPVTPGFAAWTRTTEGDRLKMSPTKDSSVMTSKTTGGNTSPAANATFLNRQYVSDPMEAGIAFVTTDTFSCQVRCQESAVNDNINRAPICIKVYSSDGTTLQATLKALGAYGPNTTEWPTSLTNKEVAAAVALGANYTTVLGDRLVIEIGGQVDNTGGTTVTGTQSFGSDSVTDLPVDETTTAANNPWFSISRTVTFQTSVAVTGNAGTGSVGTVVPGNSQVATGNTGTSAVGTLTPGNSIALSGNVATGSPGTLTPMNSLALSGNLATSGIGSVGTKFDLALSGVLATGSPGSLALDTRTFALSGVSASISIGSLSPALGIVLGGLAGTGNIGSVVPSTGPVLTGVSAAGVIGDLVLEMDIGLSGVQATVGEGTLTPPVGGSNPSRGMFAALVG